MNYNINTAAQVPQQQTLLMSTFSIQQRQNQNNNLVGIIHTVTTPTNGNAQDFSTRQCTAIAAAPQGHHLANGQLIRNTSGAVGQTHNFGSDQLASGGIRYVVHGNNGYYSQNQGSNLSDSLGDSAVTPQPRHGVQTLTRNISHPGAEFHQLAAQGVCRRSTSMNDAQVLHRQKQSQPPSSIICSNRMNAERPSGTVHHRQTVPVLPTSGSFMNTPVFSDSFQMQSQMNTQSTTCIPALNQNRPQLDTSRLPPPAYTMSAQSTTCRPALYQNQPRLHTGRLPTQAHLGSTQQVFPQVRQHSQTAACNAKAARSNTMININVPLGSSMESSNDPSARTLHVSTVDGRVFPATISLGTFKALVQEISMSIRSQLASKQSNVDVTQSPLHAPTNMPVNRQDSTVHVPRSNIPFTQPVHSQANTAGASSSTYPTTNRVNIQGSTVTVSPSTSPARSISASTLPTSAVNDGSACSSSTFAARTQSSLSGNMPVSRPTAISVAPTEVPTFTTMSESLVTTTSPSLNSTVCSRVASFTNAPNPLTQNINVLQENANPRASTASNCTVPTSPSDNPDSAANFKVPQSHPSNSCSATSGNSDPAISKELWEYLYSPQVMDPVIDDEPQSEDIPFWTCDPDKWKRANENSRSMISSDNNENCQSLTTDKLKSSTNDLGVSSEPNQTSINNFTNFQFTDSSNSSNHSRSPATCKVTSSANNVSMISESIQTLNDNIRLSKSSTLSKPSEIDRKQADDNTIIIIDDDSNGSEEYGEKSTFSSPKSLSECNGHWVKTGYKILETSDVIVTEEQYEEQSPPFHSCLASSPDILPHQISSPSDITQSMTNSAKNASSHQDQRMPYTQSMVEGRSNPSNAQHDLGLGQQGYTDPTTPSLPCGGTNHNTVHNDTGEGLLGFPSSQVQQSTNVRSSLTFDQLEAGKDKHHMQFSTNGSLKCNNPQKETGIDQHRLTGLPVQCSIDGKLNGSDTEIQTNPIELDLHQRFTATQPTSAPTKELLSILLQRYKALLDTEKPVSETRNLGGMKTTDQRVPSSVAVGHITSEDCDNDIPHILNVYSLQRQSETELNPQQSSDGKGASRSSSVGDESSTPGNPRNDKITSSVVNEIATNHSSKVDDRMEECLNSKITRMLPPSDVTRPMPVIHSKPTNDRSVGENRSNRISETLVNIADSHEVVDLQRNVTQLEGPLKSSDQKSDKSSSISPSLCKDKVAPSTEKGSSPAFPQLSEMHNYFNPVCKMYVSTPTVTNPLILKLKKSKRKTKYTGSDARGSVNMQTGRTPDHVIDSSVGVAAVATGKDKKISSKSFKDCAVASMTLGLEQQQHSDSRGDERIIPSSVLQKTLGDAESSPVTVPVQSVDSFLPTTPSPVKTLAKGPLDGVMEAAVGGVDFDNGQSVRIASAEQLLEDLGGNQQNSPYSDVKCTETTLNQISIDKNVTGVCAEPRSCNGRNALSRTDQPKKPTFNKELSFQDPTANAEPLHSKTSSCSVSRVDKATLFSPALEPIKSQLPVDQIDHSSAISSSSEECIVIDVEASHDGSSADTDNAVPSSDDRNLLKATSINDDGCLQDTCTNLKIQGSPQSGVVQPPSNLNASTLLSQSTVIMADTTIPKSVGSGNSKRPRLADWLNSQRSPAKVSRQVVGSNGVGKSNSKSEWPNSAVLKGAKSLDVTLLHDSASNEILHSDFIHTSPPNNHQTVKDSLVTSKHDESTHMNTPPNATSVEGDHPSKPKTAGMGKSVQHQIQAAMDIDPVAEIATVETMHLENMHDNPASETKKTVLPSQSPISTGTQAKNNGSINAIEEMLTGPKNPVNPVNLMNTSDKSNGMVSQLYQAHKTRDHGTDAKLYVSTAGEQQLNVTGEKVALNMTEHSTRVTDPESPSIPKNCESGDHVQVGKVSPEVTSKHNQYISHTLLSQKARDPSRKSTLCSIDTRSHEGGCKIKDVKVAQWSVSKSSSGSVSSERTITETHTKKLKIKPNLSKLHVGYKKLIKPRTRFQIPLAKPDLYSRFNQMSSDKSKNLDNVINVSYEQPSLSVSFSKPNEERRELSADNPADKSPTIERLTPDTKQDENSTLNEDKLPSMLKKTTENSLTNSMDVSSLKTVPPNIYGNDMVEIEVMDIQKSSETNQLADNLSDMTVVTKTATKSSLACNTMGEPADEFSDISDEDESITEKVTTVALKISERDKDTISDISHEDEFIDEWTSTPATKTGDTVQPISDVSNIKMNVETGNRKAVHTCSEDKVSNEEIIQPNADQMTSVMNSSTKSYLHSMLYQTKKRNGKSPRQDDVNCSVSPDAHNSDNDEELVIDTDHDRSDERLSDKEYIPNNKNLSSVECNSSEDNWPFLIARASHGSIAATYSLSDSNPAQHSKRLNSVELGGDKLLSIERNHEKKDAVEFSSTSSNMHHDTPALVTESNHKNSGCSSVSSTVFPSHVEKELPGRRNVFETLVNLGGDRFISPDKDNNDSRTSDIEENSRSPLPCNVRDSPIPLVTDKRQNAIDSPNVDNTECVNKSISTDMVQSNDQSSVRIGCSKKLFRTAADDIEMREGISQTSASQNQVPINSSDRNPQLLVAAKSSNDEFDNQSVLQDIKPYINELSPVIPAMNKLTADKGGVPCSVKVENDDSPSRESRNENVELEDRTDIVNDAGSAVTEDTSSNVGNVKELMTIADIGSAASKSRSTLKDSSTGAETCRETAKQSSDETESEPNSRIKSLFNQLMDVVESPAKSVTSSDNFSCETNEELDSSVQDAMKSPEHFTTATSGSRETKLLVSNDILPSTKNTDTENGATSTIFPSISFHLKNKVVSDARIKAEIIKHSPTQDRRNCLPDLSDADDESFASSDSESETRHTLPMSTKIDSLRNPNSESHSSLDQVSIQTNKDSIGQAPITREKSRELQDTATLRSKLFTSDKKLPNAELSTLKISDKRIQKLDSNPSTSNTEMKTLLNLFHIGDSRDFDVENNKVLEDCGTRNDNASSQLIEFIDGSIKTSNRMKSSLNQIIPDEIPIIQREKPAGKETSVELSESLPGYRLVDHSDSKISVEEHLVNVSTELCDAKNCKVVLSNVVPQRGEICKMTSKDLAHETTIADETPATVNSDVESETSEITSDVSTLVIDENCDETSSSQDMHIDVINISSSSENSMDGDGMLQASLPIPIQDSHDEICTFSGSGVSASILSRHQTSSPARDSEDGDSMSSPVKPPSARRSNMRFVSSSPGRVSDIPSSPLEPQKWRKTRPVSSNSSDDEFFTPDKSTSLSESYSKSNPVFSRSKKPRAVVTSDEDEEVDVVSVDILETKQNSAKGQDQDLANRTSKTNQNITTLSSKKSRITSREKRGGLKKSSSKKHSRSSSNADCTKQRERVTDDDRESSGNEELMTKHNHPYILMDYSSEEDVDNYQDIVISAKHRTRFPKWTPKDMSSNATNVDSFENSEVYDSDSSSGEGNPDHDTQTNNKSSSNIPEMPLRGLGVAFDDSSPNRFTFSVVKRIIKPGDSQHDSDLEQQSSTSPIRKSSHQKPKKTIKTASKVTPVTKKHSKRGSPITPGNFTQPVKTSIDLISDFMMKKYAGIVFDDETIPSESEEEPPSKRRKLFKDNRYKKDDRHAVSRSSDKFISERRMHNSAASYIKENKARRRLLDGDEGTSSDNLPPFFMRGVIRTASGRQAWFTRDRCKLKPCSVILRRCDEGKPPGRLGS